MPLLMLGITILYVAAIFAVTQRAVRTLVQRTEQETLRVEEEYRRQLSKKMDIMAEKKKIETKAAEIFTLYDMTKEITKNFNEKEAFEIFRRMLSKNIHVEDCQLLEPLSEKIKDFQKDPDYFLFLLKGRRRVMGYLALKGVTNHDVEKGTILAHQFALALRRIRLYQEVERLAVTDSLTEVNTRRYILDHFEKELRRSLAKRTPLSFLMIDVDLFKDVNDEYGHLAGDMILRKIAAVIQANIREIDLAGRYGGEEFCVVLPETDRRGAAYVAERIRSAVEHEPIRAYDTVVKATVSIGAVTFPDDGQVASELIDKADSAMYRAKKKGRKAVCACGVKA